MIFIYSRILYDYLVIFSFILHVESILVSRTHGYTAWSFCFYFLIWVYEIEVGIVRIWYWYGPDFMFFLFFFLHFTLTNHVFTRMDC